jgi:hypothetical protein
VRPILGLYGELLAAKKQAAALPPAAAGIVPVPLQTADLLVRVRSRRPLGAPKCAASATVQPVHCARLAQPTIPTSLRDTCACASQDWLAVGNRKEAMFPKTFKFVGEKGNSKKLKLFGTLIKQMEEWIEGSDADGSATLVTIDGVSDGSAATGRNGIRRQRRSSTMLAWPWVQEWPGLTQGHGHHQSTKGDRRSDTSVADANPPSHA